MEGSENRSSEAMENENSKVDEEIRDVKNDEQASRNKHSDCTVDNSLRGGSKVRQLETLTSVHLSNGGSQSDFNESSHILSEVPVEFSLQPIH